MRRTYATLFVAIAVVVGGVPTTLGAVGTDGGTAADTVERTGVSAVDTAAQATAGAVAQDGNATLTFEDQSSTGNAVTVQQATLNDGGFVAVHTTALLNGSVLDSVVGVSTYLDAGESEDVTVELDDSLDESQQLIAVAYRDSDGDEAFDFVESQGATDGTYLNQNQQIVADAAQVTVEADAETTTTTEPTATETTTAEPVETTTAEPVETTTEETTTTDETTTTEEPTETTFETVTPTETVATTTAEPTATETPTAEPTETTTEETTTAETTTIEETTTAETTATTEAPPETATATTTEEPPETTTEVGETTTEETTTEAPDPPVAERRVEFSVDNAHVENVSFVAGEGEVDRTIAIEDATFADRALELDVTELLYGDATGEADDASDQRAVRFVVRNVSLQNVAFALTVPEDLRLEYDGDELPDEETTSEDPTETTTEAEETTTEEPTETTTETPTETTTEEPAETTTEAPDDAVESLRVSDLSVPEVVVLNEGKLVVSARLENPGESALTESVQLRIGGTVVAAQEVAVEPSETESVQFRLDRTELDVEAGETFVGVLTRDFGQVEVVTVRETGASDDETTTGAGDGTTTTTEETTATEETTTTETDAEDASLRVSGLDAPGSIVLDDGTLAVSADLQNPGEETVTDTAQLRLDGTVVAEQEVEVGAGETEPVEFEVSTADLGLAPGEAFLEVLTREYGETITVTVEEESDE